jgi:hypothetical protein
LRSFTSPAVSPGNVEAERGAIIVSENTSPRRGRAKFAGFAH